MSRQAARKKKTTKATTVSSKSASLWLVLGILGGLALAGIFYLKQNHQVIASMTHHQKHHHLVAKSKHQTAAIASTAQNETNSQPQFDFYNILSGQKETNHHAEAHARSENNPPEKANEKSKEKPSSAKLELPTPATSPTSKAKTQEISVVDATQTAEKNTETTRSSEPGKSKVATGYILQISAVKSFEEADKLKAQLTMLGYNVVVQKNNRDHQVIYRVILGPYPSVAGAQSQQMKLRKNNIASIIVKTG